MSIKTIFEKLLPFLFTAAERMYDGLPQAQKEALLKSGQFGQVLKTELANGYAAVSAVATKQLGLTSAQVDALVTSLAAEMNIYITQPSDLIDILQAKVNAGMTDSSWDSLWTTVSGQLAIVLTGGTISWPVLALGLLEFVYQKLIKPKTT